MIAEIAMLKFCFRWLHVCVMAQSLSPLGMHVFLEYADTVASKFASAPGPFKDRGDTPR